ncbi:MAG: carbamoyltransferase HypF [Syntrophaceae bacterium]|nr:carbamoyltransferase HypF [Syntrophaceae bacterium]
MKRVEIKITGIVQGIGFRPYIYNLAQKHFIRGWVLNNEKGVFIDAEGEDGYLDQFIQEIPKLAPPLARIESFQVKLLKPFGYITFEIRKSEEAQEKFVLISPDVATCDQCLSELFSQKNFRYRYPFINCTLCGPRFTIIQDIPYDRHKTTMAPFVMCPICQKEYEDPSDRRFHAQPNACPACGPSLHLEDRERKEVPGDSIENTLQLLKMGCIVAIKGLGGFHLACDARNQKAVSALRSRKFREDKPFAVMCSNMEEVKEHCEVNEEEEKLLLSVERPIVILRSKGNSTIAHAVAPYQDTLGVMLPYSPLHHLLLNGPLKTLVMTSGNISDEPIAYENEEAKSRLGNIADYFLFHNREIHMRCDDSVTRIVEGKPYILRRSRGYVPFPIKLSFPLEMILACGGELKNTFCLTRGQYAFMSHHIGDLENLETLTSFEEGIEHFKRLFYIEPRAIAYDLHPDYLSTKYALSIPDLPKVWTQHHHAHIVSAMAENGIEGDVIGVALDGTGFGTDSTIWGGEFIKANLKDFDRLAHLKKVPMPGGSMAIKEPWRMAMVYLSEAFGEEVKDLKIDLMRKGDPQKWNILKKAIKKKINTPWTSSMGRLFDAVSSLLSIRDEVHYEGQAAIELEMVADRSVKEKYSFHLRQDEKPMVIDSTEMIRGIVHDLTEGTPSSKISGKFHQTIAHLIVETCEIIRSEEKLNRVVLSGGVFQNIFLLSLVAEGLKRSGFDMYTHHLVPTNDGGISLGQAVIAHMRLFQCA